jgi:adenylosuccinate lyase
MIDLCRDVWGYISRGLFSQKVLEKEVGSSTMPHKVNPIDFENAEGNFGLANALAQHFAGKLPISRWQRDLSDSTVMRSTGTMFGYTILGMQSLLRGFSKLQPRKEHMLEELQAHPEVLAEAYQVVMKRYGIHDAYERMKKHTRGSSINLAGLKTILTDDSWLPKKASDDLAKLAPHQYTGLASKLAEDFARQCKKALEYSK